MRKYVLTALICAIPAVVAAQDAAQKTVEARQGYYKLLGANMGVLAGMAKGEIEYEGAAAQTAADNIVLLTTYNLGHLYPMGTSSSDMEGTRAKAEIWEDFDAVQAKADKLFEAATELTKVAGFDKADMAAALGPVGGACKSCHDDYREK